MLFSFIVITFLIYYCYFTVRELTNYMFNLIIISEMNKNDIGS